MLLPKEWLKCTFADELDNAEMLLKVNSMFLKVDTQNNSVNNSICCRLHTSLRILSVFRFC